MKIIEPYFEIISSVDGGSILRHIERCGRVCYKSEDKITDDSAEKFVANIIKRGHEAVLEHQSITVRFVCDRGVSHEIVRHRLASFCQESTRYCNYSKGDFGGEITVIRPCYLLEGKQGYDLWWYACQKAESAYFDLLSYGCSPQEARAVLPNSLKTEGHYDGEPQRVAALPEAENSERCSSADASVSTPPALHDAGTCTGSV